MIPKPTANLSAISTARAISMNLYRYYKNNALYPIIRFFRRRSYLSVLRWFFPVVCVVKDKRSFFQKLSLLTLLALWVFVGHASAQSVSLTHVTDGTAGMVSGQGTEIVVDLSQEGMTQSVNAIQIMFEFDASLLSLTAPSGWLLSGNDTVTLLFITASSVPASAHFTFTTKVDVTGREFSIGIKEISLDQVTLTPSAIVWFNLPHLYLDTQIESPAQNNSVLTLSAKRPGDTIVFQLFAPELAGQQFNTIQLELALQGKRLSNYISSSVSGGWLSQVSGSGNLVLSLLSISSISVPSSGYLGQIDLSVIGTLTSDDLLRVQSGNLDGIQNLTVSNAVLTFTSLCPGDFDNNGIVGIPDFLLFVDVFGTSLGDARYNALMDMDGNGEIGIPDFLAFVQVFGTQCSNVGGQGGNQVSGSDLVVGIDPIGISHLSLMPGESFVFWIGVHNQGTGSSSATTLRYYRSDDATLTNSDTQVGSTQVGGLEASDSSGERVTFTAPSSVGMYYYGGCVDPVSGESNTNNNCSGVQVTVTEGGVSQREALVALYNATDGDNWTNNDNWLTDNDISTWYGVSASNGWVTNLSLAENDLTGEIPSELGNLTNLTGLWLHVNQLSGAIPRELGNLTNLTGLALHTNQLSSAIPSELGNLTNLTGLWLDHNQLSGAIPPELGNLTKLDFLALAYNQLEGPIPSELGNLTKLDSLFLQSNQLSGAIPPELGNLTNLTGLWLDQNQLSGAIPTELGNLTNLKDLYLYGNASLTGALPLSLTRLTKLEGFNFNNTGLCAPSDAAFQTWFQGITNTSGSNCSTTVTEGGVSQREALVALYNATDGDNWTNNDNWLTDNDISTWYGVSASKGWVTELDLRNNNLTGEIPSELGKLTNLTDLLTLSRNALSGSIPTELGKLTNLTHLSLRDNALSGSIPTELGKLTNLTSLSLGSNALSGLYSHRIG